MMITKVSKQKEYEGMSINDCLDRLEQIANYFEFECHSCPTAFQVFDSELLHVSIRLNELLITYKKNDTDDIYSSCEHNILVKRFFDSSVEINDSIRIVFNEGIFGIEDNSEISNTLKDMYSYSPFDDEDDSSPYLLLEYIDKVKLHVQNAYNKLHWYVSQTLFEIEQALGTSVEMDKLLKQFEIGFRAYLREHYEQEKEALSKHACNFKKSIIEPLEPQHWECLFMADKIAAANAESINTKIGFNALRQYISAHFHMTSDVLFEKACKEIYSFSLRRGMYENNSLVQDIERLHEPKKLLMPEEVGSLILLDELTNKQLDFVYMLMNRYNIIMVGMFPELESEYKLWIKGADDAHDDAYTDLTNNEIKEDSKQIISRQNPLVNYKEKIRSLFFAEQPVLNYTEMSQLALLFLSLLGKKVIAKDCETTKFVEYVAEIVPELYKVEKNSKNKNQKVGKRTKVDYAKSINNKLQNQRNLIDTINGQGDVKDIIKKIYQSQPNTAGKIARKIDVIFEILK